jgi:hypothetical protein
VRVAVRRGILYWQGSFLDFLVKVARMKRSLSRLGLFFSAVSAAGCYWGYYDSGPPPVQCYYATDCLAGFRCDYGVCVLAPPYGGTGGTGGSGATDASSEGGTDASSDGPYDGAPEDGPMDASRPECSIDAPPSLADGAVDSGCTVVSDLAPKN